MVDKTEKHTGEDLVEMDRYEIYFDGEKYILGDYSYERLKDAINYAKLQQNDDLSGASERKKSIDEAEENNRIKNIPFVTSESFSASQIIKTHGMARGSTVRAKHIGKDFMADIKNLVGGEVKGYTELLAEGREEAIYRMQSDAVRLGANAIVSVRFTSSTIGGGIAEILAYGTAVTIESD